MVGRLIGGVLGCALLLLGIGCSTLSNEAPLSAIAKCDGCHQLPPDDEGVRWKGDTSAIPKGIHSYHVAQRKFTCDKCHYGYDTVSGSWSTPANHRSDSVRYDSSKCVVCHLYDNCNSKDCHASPPDAPPLRKKNHEVHVKQKGYKCGVCHKGYDLARKIAPYKTLHNNGKTDVVFDLSVVNGSPMPLDPAGPPMYNQSTGTCARVYCHGATLRGGRKSVRLDEVFSSFKPSRCDACHPKASLVTLVDYHKSEEHKENFDDEEDDCLICHNGCSYKRMIVDTSLHVNGRTDLEGCLNCHEIHEPFGVVDSVIKRVK